MAFLVPHAPRQPIFRAPGIVLLLIAGLVAAHVARSLMPPQQSDALIYQFAFIPARYGAGMDIGGLFQLAFPLVTYMALHNDYTHLAINCLWLLAFGPIVARRFGAGLFLLFFVLCGLAGAAAHLAVNWASPEPVIGASGAISGLMAAAIRLLPTQRPAWMTDAPEGPLLPLWSRQILLFSLVWAGVNAVAGITGLGFGTPGQIAWQAHMGGFIAGLLLCGPFDRLRPPPISVPL